MNLLDYVKITPSSAGEKAVQDTASRLLPKWATDLLPGQKAPEAETREVIKTVPVTDPEMVKWLIVGSVTMFAIFFISARKRRRR